MDFSKFINTQPKVKKIIDNSIASNRLSQVLLFEGAVGTPKMMASLYLASKLLCENNNACGNCYECSRIEKGVHPRVYIIDAIDNSIKKEQIELLEDEFSKSGLEEGIRVFIINNIDKATLASANSLLKFLEEIKDNTYGILITDNINGVLSTIKSRSQIISFSKVSLDSMIKEYEEQGINFEVSKVLSLVTNDTDEGIKLVEEGIILDIIDLAKKLNESFFSDKNPVLVFNEIGKFMLDIKDKKYHQIFFDVFTLITNDRLYYLLGKMDEVIFMESISSIENIYNIDYQKTFSQVEKILEYKKRLTYNVNLELLYISLLLEMVKIYG